MALLINNNLRKNTISNMMSQLNTNSSSTDFRPHLQIKTNVIGVGTVAKPSKRFIPLALEYTRVYTPLNCFDPPLARQTSVRRV